MSAELVAEASFPGPPRQAWRLAALTALAILVAAQPGGSPAQGARPPVASPPSPTPTANGPRLPLSLADAVFIGLRDNRTVKSAYLSRVAEKYDLFVAEARFRPVAVIVGSVEANRQGDAHGATSQLSPAASWLLPTGATFDFGWARQTTRGRGASFTTEVASVGVNQPLLRGAGLAVNNAPVRLAQLQEAINRLNLKTTVSGTVTGIITAYRNLAQAQQQLVIARQSLERSNAQLSTNQALIEAGRMAAADIVQTQADIAGQQVSLLQAEQQRNSAQLALLTLLAMDLHTDVVAADPLDADYVPIDLAQAIAVALDNRPDYLGQRRALEQARQGLVVARNNRLWDVSVYGTLQHQSDRGASFLDPTDGAPTGANLPRTNSAVGVQFRIPLGDYSLRQGEIQASTQVRIQEIQVEDLRQRVEAQVRDAVQGVELAWRQVEAARLARNLAARTLDLERERLQAGRASNFELLTFEANLRSADLQALNASINYKNALTSLDQQLGTTLDTWKIDLRD
uniref:Outer membrane efflux protein n=1 Tax=Caulobacter sp. (strain K31) TaxID=366602 RepID=B0SXK5_CAUSK